jgi:hypothetical protein
MLASMMTYYRAWENRRFVRRLLREKQPEFAAALESAVREPPCPLCHGSQCSMPGRLTPSQPSQLPQPRRHMVPAGHAGNAARPARVRQPQPSRIQ